MSLPGDLPFPKVLERKILRLRTICLILALEQYRMSHLSVLAGSSRQRKGGKFGANPALSRSCEKMLGSRRIASVSKSECPPIHATSIHICEVQMSATVFLTHDRPVQKQGAESLPPRLSPYDLPPPNPLRLDE